MNEIYLHLITNHIPVLLTFFTIPVFVWGLVKKNQSFIYLSLISFVIVGIMTYVVFQSGSLAEELVERLPGISEASLENHEEAGETALWIGIFLGLFGLVGLVFQKMKLKYSRKILWIVLLYGSFTAGWFIYTANLGGKIIHTEINNTQTPALPDNDD